MIGFIFQAALLFLSLFLGAYLKNETLNYVEYILVFAPWLITLWLTHKNKPKFYQKKVKYVLAPFLRAYLVQFILTVPLIYFMGYENSLFFLIMQSLAAYFLVEWVIYFIIVKLRKEKKDDKEEAPVKKYTQEKFKLPKPKYADIKSVTQEDIKFQKSTLLELYDFEGNTDGSFVIGAGSIASSDLLILNTLVNNFKDINANLKGFHDHVNRGGYLIIGYKNLEDIEDRINQSKGLAKFFKKVKFYVFDRAFPKIPVFSALHKALTLGKNKVISRTEVWGRLMYHGFDVKKEVREGDIMYLIAQKDRTISENPSPSYSPLIRLNRVSLYGNLVKIYKVRSMYPYSEFLQEKVYEMNSLSSTGKFSQDFRITKLGKIYRKYWIDELPQFLDWSRGTIKLVGIRAMSQHFFSLYSKEYQELFYQVKPGIISPIFDEETDSFETIQKIEQEYLEKYLKSPIKTDIEYFFITIKHMLKGVRSK